MHGLINRSLQCFVQETYGEARWIEVRRAADLAEADFEAMLTHDDAVTETAIDAAARVLGRRREGLLEDLGTFLVSHPSMGRVRRLLRYGGEGFTDFLHSLEDLPDRARLAVPEMALPPLRLEEIAGDAYRLTCAGDRAGLGHVILGALRAMADDYGALASLEPEDDRSGATAIRIEVHSTTFAEGRHFALAEGPR